MSLSNRSTRPLISPAGGLPEQRVDGLLGPDLDGFDVVLVLGVGLELALEQLLAERVGQGGFLIERDLAVAEPLGAGGRVDGGDEEQCQEEEARQHERPRECAMGIVG
jgi:hypothetical protein